jgi:hypothetical protein
MAQLQCNGPLAETKGVETAIGGLGQLAVRAGDAVEVELPGDPETLRQHGDAA